MNLHSWYFESRAFNSATDETVAHSPKCRLVVSDNGPLRRGIPEGNEHCVLKMILLLLHKLLTSLIAEHLNSVADALLDLLELSILLLTLEVCHLEVYALAMFNSHFQPTAELLLLYPSPLLQALQLFIFELLLLDVDWLRNVEPDDFEWLQLVLRVNLSMVIVEDFLETILIDVHWETLDKNSKV